MSAIQLGEVAPPALSRALELRRFSDPGLIESATPAQMVAYRCLRSVGDGFGVDDPGMILPTPQRVPGFLVCLHGRSYIQPLLLASACNQRSSQAVMELSVPAGTPALWIAGGGDPATVNGADMVCLDNITIRPVGHRHQHGTTVLEIQVEPS